MATKLENWTNKSKSTLVKRARAKYLSKRLALELIEANPESSLIRSYKNSTLCSHTLVQTGKKLTTTYCKNRWCAVCNRIRTGKLINGFMPVLKGFNDPYFVTLTKETVKEGDLSGSIELMGKVWRSIMVTRENQKKRKIKGIRKAECTIRPNGMYHYHFHIIIEGKDNAHWLITEWLKRCPKSYLNAQDARAANDGSFIELFKYFTKLTTKNKDTISLIPYARMDVIFRAMYNRKVFQSFGGVKMVNEEIDDVNSQEYDFLEECEKVWKWYESDWIDQWGECLTNYQPNEELKQIFSTPS